MPALDTLIRNARIVDGTGNPWFRADVGIKGRTIRAVGRQSSMPTATEVIDVGDNVLCPGFIDLHTHSDFLLLRDPLTLSKLKQGVTTQAIGQCGISAAPI
jgi:N-acyl-D-amino-acid deacylase